MAKRQAVLATMVAAIVAAAAALMGTTGPAQAARPEFWITGEHTGHQYLYEVLFTDQEPHQDLANATAYANNNCPGSSFCLVQRDAYGWGGYAVWIITGCDTYKVSGALDTFRVNNTRGRRVNAYNANRQVIGHVKPYQKRAVTWDPIWFIATCR
jgi:hypothetical protein